MSLALWTFIISGGIIVLMLIIKAIQLKAEILLFWPDVRNKGEIVLKQHRGRIRSISGQFTSRNLYIILHFILSRIRAMFAWIVHKLDQRSHRLVSLIRGRHTIDPNRGRTSNFLTDINNAKDQFREGEKK